MSGHVPYQIDEKSLGAVAKGGTSALMAVFDYAERINSPGFVFMNTPGYDPVSLTGLAARGVNLLAFTTGRGSAIGFPTVPVFKISTNTDTFKNMRDNMDINAGRIMDGEATVEEVGREIFSRLLDIASGTRTASEILGHSEFVPWRIGQCCRVPGRELLWNHALVRTAFSSLREFYMS